MANRKTLTMTNPKKGLTGTGGITLTGPSSSPLTLVTVLSIDSISTSGTYDPSAETATVDLPTIPVPPSKQGAYQLFTSEDSNLSQVSVVVDLSNNSVIGFTWQVKSASLSTHLRQIVANVIDGARDLAWNLANGDVNSSTEDRSPASAKRRVDPMSGEYLEDTGT